MANHILTLNRNGPRDRVLSAGRMETRIVPGFSRTEGYPFNSIAAGDGVLIREHDHDLVVRTTIARVECKETKTLLDNINLLRRCDAAHVIRKYIRKNQIADLLKRLKDTNVIIPNPMTLDRNLLFKYVMLAWLTDFNEISPLRPPQGAASTWRPLEDTIELRYSYAHSPGHGAGGAVYQQH